MTVNTVPVNDGTGTTQQAVVFKVGSDVMPGIGLSDASGNQIAGTVGGTGNANAISSIPVLAYLLGFNGTTWDGIKSGLSGILSSITGFLNAMPYGVYNSVVSTLTNGQFGPIPLDANGNILVNPGVTSATLLHTAPSITTSNTQILPARNSRQTLIIQNNDPSITVYISFGVSAVAGAPSYKLPPGTSLPPLSCITNQAVFAIGSGSTSNLSVIEG